MPVPTLFLGALALGSVVAEAPLDSDCPDTPLHDAPLPGSGSRPRPRTEATICAFSHPTHLPSDPTGTNPTASLLTLLLLQPYGDLHLSLKQLLQLLLNILDMLNHHLSCMTCQTRLNEKGSSQAQGLAPSQDLSWNEPKTFPTWSCLYSSCWGSCTYNLYRNPRWLLSH